MNEEIKNQQHGRTFVERRLALRWRLDYAGRRPVFGAWSSEKIMAFPHVGKPNITKASIEATDLVTGEVRTLASCPGYEWIGFRWIYVATLRAGKNPGVIHGLSIETQLEMANVYIDGKVRMEPNRAWRKP